MQKINFVNKLLTILLLTVSSRHSFCRWQTNDWALIDIKVIKTYSKTHLNYDFRRIALPSWHQANLKGYHKVTVILIEAFEVPETIEKTFNVKKISKLVDIETIQPTKVRL